MWHQFHAKYWRAQEFEGHRPVTLQNSTGFIVMVTWLLLDSQLMVDLISDIKMLINIPMVQDEDAIRVHCNSGVKILNHIGNLPGYGAVWYEPTGIDSILSILRVTKKFQVVFDSEGGLILWIETTVTSTTSYFPLC